MASYLDKVQVNTAVTEKNKFVLDHQQITTSDFFETGVATIMELVPGSRLDVKMESFARLNPLFVPTMGRARMNNRAFFVPFRTLFRGWDDFIVNTMHMGSDAVTYNGGQILNSVPYFDGAELCGAFLNYVGSDVNDNTGMVYRPAGGLNGAYDFVSSGTAYAYTVKGRQCLKILEQLGYKLDYRIKGQQNYFSALPLLALGRIFADWYMPSQYANLPSYDFILSLCNYDVTVGPLVLNANMIQSILIFCSYVMYNSDLYTAAFDVPNQNVAGNLSGDFKLVNIDTIKNVYSSTLLNDQSGVHGYVTNNAGTASTSNRIGGADAPFISPYADLTTSQSSSYTATPISEYLLHALHSLSDFMKRNQLAGSKVFDRYLARFGKALPAEKLNRSLYLGCATQDIQIGDVMSTADTSTAQLGSFSGKGMSYGNGHFSVDTDEFGYFIVISSIVPVTGYFQGIDPLVQRQSVFDFYQPEMDNLGVEPITAANLYIDSAGPALMTGNPYEQIFGFVPRYAAYKSATCMDRLTGNFRLPSIQGGAYDNASGAWHLMREFDPSDFSNDYVNCVHSPAFIAGETYDNPYKRIFYNNDPDAPDNFTVIHNFEIAEYAPMKPLYDTYEFEDKGKKVTLDVNGVKMN